MINTLNFILHLKKLVIFFSFILLCSQITQAGETTPPLKEFTLGFYYPSINAITTRTEFYTALNLWLKELRPELNQLTPKILFFNTIENMKLKFLNNELDLITAPPLLIADHFDINTLADGFSGRSLSGSSFDIAIFALKTKNINKIIDLKNTRLILPTEDKLATIFLNSRVIPVFHQTYNKVFSSIKRARKHNKIIHQLFFNQADVGIAYLETFHVMAELNPQIKDKIKIIASFPIYSPNYSFFHQHVPEEIRKSFIHKTINLNNSIRAKELLQNFKLATIAPCPVNSLLPFIELLKQNKRLLKQLEPQ